MTKLKGFLFGKAMPIHAHQGWIGPWQLKNNIASRTVVHPWSGAIMTYHDLKGVVTIRSIRESSTAELFRLVREKDLFFPDYFKKNLWNMISFIFPRLMWRDITTIFPQPRSTGPQLMGCEGTAWNTSGYRTGGFKMLYALVNVNKKLWKDPPCYSWVNQLFRLGHFQ